MHDALPARRACVVSSVWYVFFFLFLCKCPTNTHHRRSLHQTKNPSLEPHQLTIQQLMLNFNRTMRNIYSLPPTIIPTPMKSSIRVNHHQVRDPSSQTTTTPFSLPFLLIVSIQALLHPTSPTPMTTTLLANGKQEVKVRVKRRRRGKRRL